MIIDDINICEKEYQQQASQEIVKLSWGTTVKVKRSRIIDQTVHLTEAAIKTLDKTIGLEIGIEPLELNIEGKLQNEIQTNKGFDLRNSLTIEQEVTLQGNAHRTYKLTWYDQICYGKATVRNKPGEPPNIRIDFRFKKGSNLTVKGWH